MSIKRINIGTVGLGFGKEFIPIYQQHPNSGKVAICTHNYVRDLVDREEAIY
jgi:hypothetical protein